MKRTYFTLLAILVLSEIQAQPPVPGNWQITFEDEFEGDLLDPLKWRMAGHVLHFNGLASNDSRNIRVNNGNLEITAEVRSSVFKGETYPYASGEITSFRLFRQAYGYFEARIRYDAIQGSWPAFWTMPDRGKRGSADQMREMYIKFSVDTTGNPVESALLRLKVKSLSSTNDSYLTVHRTLSTDWTENDLTWTTKPLYDPLWIQQLTGTVDGEKQNDMSPGEFLEVDVTAEVNRAIEENTEVGFCLLDRYMRSIQIVCHSKEAVNEADRPYLLVDEQVILPAADNYVRGGQYAENNYGSEAELVAFDQWANTSSTYDGAMETDIMETLGIWGDNYNQHALHWDGYDDDHQHAGSGKLELAPTGDGFHTYGMYWKPGKIEFYTDGIKTWEYADNRVSSVPGFLILSHQLGGWDGNSSIQEEFFPATMEVDYVRVYEDAAGASVNLANPVDEEVIEPGTEIEFRVNSQEYGGSIDKVVFYRKGVKLGEDLTYPYAYTYTENERGRIQFAASALNEAGQLMDADTVEIISAAYPEIEITSPSDGAYLNAPGNFDIRILAQSEGGTVDSVLLFIDSKRIDTLTEIPFTLSVDDLFPGNYALSATAIDDLGLRALSDTVRIGVKGMEIIDPWNVNDIGAPLLSGNATYYLDEFYLEGAGIEDADRDEFIFVYQTLEGDCEIIARLGGITAESGRSGAGLMIRESLESDARAALLSVNQAGEVVFAYRNTQGAKLFGRADISSADSPIWLKLVRENNYFSGYVSRDSSNWDLVLDLTKLIEMNDTVLAGMASRSGMEDELARATFQSVIVHGNTVDTKNTTALPERNRLSAPELHLRQVTVTDELIIINKGRGGLKGVIHVYDLQGSLRFQTKLEQNPSTISLQELSKGMYILVFQNSDWSASTKLVL